MAKFNMHLMLFVMISIMAKGVALGDIEVFVYDSVFMRCSPNVSIDIQWHHNSYINFVYAGGQLRYPYDRRFLVKKYETTGEYDLIIPNVTLKDAGLYYCSDELSGRRINSTQLIVLYMKPVCSSNMPTDGFNGPNTCNIQTENMTFTCDVVFNGSAPHLSWRSANDNQVFNSSSCEVKSNRRSCSVTLKADPSYDGSVFRCDVGQIKLDDRRYSCNTERIKVHYFVGDYRYEEKYVNENASCMVRSNLNIRYNWTLQQDNEEIFVTSARTVSIEKPGLHQCEVEYSIRNVTCSVLLSFVNATVKIEAQKGQNTNTLLALAITLPIAFVVVFALIGLVIYILRRQRKYFSLRTDEPLTDFQLQAIESKRETLLELIDTSQLLDLLEKNGVFDKAQLDSISSKSTSREKNEALLKILRNGNLLSYWLTIGCLHQTNQSQAAEILETRDVKSSWISRITNLPLELIDMILGKSYLLSIQRQKPSLQNRKVEVVIKQLASVDFCWFQRITRRRFKIFVWSKMKKYYVDMHRLYFIFKNNQQFFEEVLRISGKTNMSLSTDYLSNPESANGKRRRSFMKRQTEIQMLRTAFLTAKNNDNIIKAFISSYDPRDQEFICEMMNIGGGAARLEIKMPHLMSVFELIRQHSEDKEMKILRSVADRDEAVWIWCHSNNALQKLTNRDGFNGLIEIDNQSLKATPDVLEHRTNIDCDHLKKKIVSIPLVFADFRTTLNFKRETLIDNRTSYSDIDKVFDFTKLKMKFYVLCNIVSWDHPGSSHKYARTSRTTIFVFEDQSPYPIVEEISSIKVAISKIIVSSVKENCLYLLTHYVKDNHYANEVIRIKIQENEENSPKHHSKWLELEDGFQPCTLSVSINGDLMMVSSSSPIILRIYYPDARLRLCVRLNEDILMTRKAVETSNGNFIILHSMKRQKEDAVSEVSRDGKTIIRRFIPQNQQQQFDNRSSFDGRDLCIDSRDRVFVADTKNQRLIVLDCYLRWTGNRILKVKNDDENEKLLWPLKLLYHEDSNEVIVAGEYEVHIYNLICK